MVQFDMPCHLFVVDIDCSIQHYISASNALDALEIAKQHHAFDAIDDDIESISVDRVPLREGKLLSFVNDDGTEISMWDEFIRDETPRYIACSEF